jgi:hypothetical protein
MATSDKGGYRKRCLQAASAPSLLTAPLRLAFAIESDEQKVVAGFSATLFLNFLGSSKSIYQLRTPSEACEETTIIVIAKNAP